jgi:hypothetical protein
MDHKQKISPLRRVAGALSVLCTVTLLLVIEQNITHHHLRDDWMMLPCFLMISAMLLACEALQGQE